MKQQEYTAKSGAHVTYTGGTTTSYTYRITGTIEQVNEEIERLFEYYHPAGYGTMVERKGTNKNGSHYAIVWRSYTCD